MAEKLSKTSGMLENELNAQLPKNSIRLRVYNTFVLCIEICETSSYL